MKRKIFPILFTLFISITAAVSAPLNILNTQIDMQIQGNANVTTSNSNYNPSYSQYGSSNSFSSGSNYLNSSITAGNLPDCPSKATAGSTAGVKFEQLAFNKYILTLSSSATGDYFAAPSDQDDFPYLNYKADSMLNFRCSFEVPGLASQNQSENSTILISLEHFGTIESVNGGMCSNYVDLNITPNSCCDSYYYNVNLMSPFIGDSGFQKNEFKGTRDFKDQWSTTIPVGSTFDVSAMMQSNAEFWFDSNNNMNLGSSASNFENGIKVYMTVLPEPTSLILFGIGSVLTIIKRKK